MPIKNQEVSVDKNNETIISESCGDAGECFNQGLSRGRKGDKANAIKLYKKSCDGGYMKGCHHLAFLEEEQRQYGRCQEIV